MAEPYPHRVEHPGGWHWSDEPCSHPDCATAQPEAEAARVEEPLERCRPKWSDLPTPPGPPPRPLVPGHMGAPSEQDHYDAATALALAEFAGEEATRDAENLIVNALGCSPNSLRRLAVRRIEQGRWPLRAARVEERYDCDACGDTDVGSYHGCFAENPGAIKVVPADAPSSSDERRWTLYVCPECGNVEGDFLWDATDYAEKGPPACPHSDQHGQLDMERVEVVPSKWKERAEELLHTLDLTNDWNWQQHRAERLRDRTRAEAAEARAEELEAERDGLNLTLKTAHTALDQAERTAADLLADRDEARREVERLREALTFAADDLDKDEAA